jgi:glycosyltransferase involved in cell wall biosynthesis
MNLSIVIPCFNEQEVLPSTIDRILAVVAPISDSFELILVDDGSCDGTWRIISDAASRIPTVRGLRLSRNFGHQIALSAGLKSAIGKRVFIIDGDLQDPPELLSEMMAALDGGADIAYGRRRIRQDESSFKRTTAYLFYRLINWLSDIDIPKDTGDFRLVTRQVLDAVNAMPERHRFLRGMFSWVGFRQVPVDYDRAGRVAGESKYPFGAMLRFAIMAITSFSVRPLRLATLIAAVFAGASLAGLVYVLVGHFMGQTVQGWTSLMIVVLFVACLQFLFLGIIGEYVGRMFIEQKSRPLYFLSEECGSDSKQVQ